MNVLLVAIGGGLGAVARYLLGVWVKDNTKQRTIPTAMLSVNLLGAFGLGLFFHFMYGEIPEHAYEQRPYLIFGIGFFGAFTTFSTFSIEAVTLMQKQKWGPFFTYLLLTIGGSILFFSLGLIIF
ncbi:CrcB protein [Evansella caseinilytica]|uniref:Fluoride-specific ion channel FluC n=1 Tax=Evansella caseinilytica TaxID=1503961 RepID=A0A1H3QF13_9BACI|nr:fluoride efflux transporter CrcB [Evansella caseinilytica]SDZ12144.1 CrcB protein [Evansella caseinilytica]